MRLVYGEHSVRTFVLMAVTDVTTEVVNVLSATMDFGARTVRGTVTPSARVASATSLADNVSVAIMEHGDKTVIINVASTALNAPKCTGIARHAKPGFTERPVEGDVRTYV